MRIFLIGFMGVGKSTLGQMVAEEIDMPFLDLDEWIEDRMQMSISEIFSTFGEPFFRKLEHDNLREAVQTYDHFMMATGGGLPCFGNNLDYMNRHGFSVYLKATVDDIEARLIHSSGKRPVLDAMNREELQTHIQSLLAKREEYYLKSSKVIDLDLALEKDQNVTRLVDLIRSLMNE